jgi:hypothetical protein
MALLMAFLLLTPLVQPLDVARVTPSELAASPELLSGGRPFILTDSMSEWEAVTRFSNMSYFAEAFPNAIVDYYPNNLDVVSKKPFLRPMADVMEEFAVPNPMPEGGWGQNGRSEDARYIHWRMTARQWNKVKGLMEPMNPFFTTDRSWMEKCIPKKKRHPRDPRKMNWPMNNWIRHMHWKIIIIGEHDSGMFFHADGAQTSTFLVQFVGRKRL